MVGMPTLSSIQKEAGGAIPSSLTLSYVLYY